MKLWITIIAGCVIGALFSTRYVWIERFWSAAILLAIGGALVAMWWRVIA